MVVALRRALEVVAATGTDKAARCDALSTVGRHVARRAGVAPGVVALAVGKAGIDLQHGARRVLGEMPTYVVHAEARPWSGRTVLRWITGRPPAHLPLVVYICRIVTGARLRTVLQDTPRVDDSVAITVLTVEASPRGVAAVTAAHPATVVHAAVNDIRTR